MAEPTSSTTAGGKGNKKRGTAAEAAVSFKRVRTLDGASQSLEEKVVEDDDEWKELSPEACPITDKDIRPFRLMDLPAEIRVEIYRACLTRPFDILLSRIPVPIVRGKVLEERQGGENAIELDGAEDVVLAPAPMIVVPPAQIGLTGLPTVARDQAAANGSHGPRLSQRESREAYIARLSRANRLVNRVPGTSSTVASAANPRAHTGTPIYRSSTTARAPRLQPTPETMTHSPRPQDADPLLINLLRASKLIYKEARNIMYGENAFCLDLETAQPTLSALHQRSRGQIRNLRLTIPTHNEILERFAEVVRLSLRYCWKLKILHINMPFVLPGTDGSGTSGNTTVYANAFDILRWLPKKCAVVLEGNVCEEIRAVVDKNANLAKSLDELQYARRQLISNESERLPVSEAKN